MLFGALALSGCSAKTSVPHIPRPELVSGTVTTLQPIYVTSDPGTEPQPLPQPTMTDAQWLEICKGDRVLMDGSARWYYAPRNDVTSLQGSQVTITDAKGAIIGLPALKLTSAEDARSGAASCHYSFRLDDFESNSNFFTVAIDGVPGTTSVTRAELVTGLNLSVG